LSPAGTDDREVPHPRATGELFGHAEAEQTLLDAYRGGRIPHAWLIGGEAGIGKATLAYRMAKFVLAHRNPQATADSIKTALIKYLDELEKLPPDKLRSQRNTRIDGFGVYSEVAN